MPLRGAARRAQVDRHGRSHCFGCQLVGLQIPRVPLGQGEEEQGEHHTYRHSTELQEAYVTSRHHLREEEVVHVAEGEKSEAEEKEASALPPVRCIVVPQHQHWQPNHHQHTQEQVQCRQTQ
uniref:Uncharacterized protein n=1 Tax=Anguilla anguilla TaxID=7936 RepID=A0A0E9U0L1_ANGAN